MAKVQKSIQWVDDLNLGGGFKYVLFAPLPGEDFFKWVETTN